MNNFEKTLEQYDYTFPVEQIAQKPAHPRDSARLLVYNRETSEITHDQYKNLTVHIPAGSVLVLNQTKVLPARIEVTKPSGGKARLLYIEHNEKLIKVLSDRKLTSGTKLTISGKLTLEVTKIDSQFYYLSPSFPAKEIYNILTKYGITPLPPYIKNPGLKGKKLLQEYNTVFAKTLGSVAAPTASLHFTKSLLSKLKKNGVVIKYVTLHVSLGTFAKLTEQQLKDKKLHQEYYEIDKATAKFLNQAKHRGRTIIAVGTTVTRTLESASNSRGELTKLSGNTDLFISEKTNLKFVDQLITNFHVPKSSLLMLVSSFLGTKKMMALYRHAIQERYRLFSFGDGMYIK